MGWFNKQEERKEMPREAPLPELPELPKLPDFSDFNSSKKEKEPLHKLPTFPNSSFGDKFSQNTIKEAVKGSPKPMPEEKEDDDEADDYYPSQMMPPKIPEKKLMEKPWGKSTEKSFTIPAMQTKPPYKFEMEEFPSDMEEIKFKGRTQEKDDYETDRIKRIEPVFIRIDKFEASLKAFEKTKKEISEMEKILKDIAEVREEEEKQLQSWQHDIMRIKEQIDKIDKDIFSKVE